jgi:hypothetical protein
MTIQKEVDEIKKQMKKEFPKTICSHKQGHNQGLQRIQIKPNKYSLICPKWSKLPLTDDKRIQDMTINAYDENMEG